MSSAVKLLQGRFGRVALLDMSAPLVAHAHPHCHVLIKAGGADTRFLVRGEEAPLTDTTAVLVNAWEPHLYRHHVAPGERTLILALYIEPSWLADMQRSLQFSAHPRFFPRCCVEINAAIKRIADEYGLHTVLVSDDPGDASDFSRTEWVLVSRSAAALTDRRIAEATDTTSEIPGLRLWTDSFNNLYKILK